MNKKYLYALAVLSLAAVSTMAVAMRANEVEYNYLDAKGKVVGGKTYYCAGGIHQWGKVTTDFVTNSTPCD